VSPFLLPHTVTPLALHVLLPGTPHNQDHSGTLGPEEFKACLISLGYDIGNDAQVLNASGEQSQMLNWEKITVFFLSFLVCLNPSVIAVLAFDYVYITFLNYFLSKYTLVSIPSLFPNCLSWENSFYVFKLFHLLLCHLTLLFLSIPQSVLFDIFIPFLHHQYVLCV